MLQIHKMLQNHKSGRKNCGQTTKIVKKILSCLLIMSPMEGEGDILFLVRILFASPLASA